MPNWSVTANGENSAVQVGASTALTLDITISPSGGYSIAPNNFVIGGAAETDGNGNQTLAETNIWEGGNVDNIVEKVEFIQAGNTVDVLARVYCEAASFVADSDVYIDIDENPNNIVTNDVYGVCTKIDYPYSANATVTITANPDGNTTVDDVQTGDASNNWVKKLTRYGDDVGVWTGLVMLQITPAANYHLVGTPTVQVTTPPGVEGLFQTLANSDGLVYITYKASEATQSLTPCELGNIIYIDYATEADAVASTNTIYGVSANTTTGYRGGAVEISVNGDAGTQYDITARNGTTNDYYNWDGTYGSSSVSAAGVIRSNGTAVHSLYIPPSSSKVVYHVLLGSVGDSTLAAGVPTSIGDLSVSQHGMNTLTVKVKTEVLGNFGTLPDSLSIKRPTRYSGDSYTKSEIKTAIIKGKTSGSSTRVKLTSLDPNLKAGMRVMGDNIPHDTVIEKVDSNLMVLSNAVDLSTVQNIQCKTKATDTVPFSFTIPPNSTPNTLSVNASNVHRKSIWGFNDVNGVVGLDQLGGTPLIVTDSHGVLESMGVTGNGIPTSTIVSSVNYSTHEVTLSQAHTGVVDGDRVFFKGANNPSVSAAHIDAEMSGSNVVISGYLMVPKIDNTANIEIFLDDIITVT